MGQPFRKVIALSRWNRDEGELDRELTAHLAMLEESYQRRGLSTEEARLAARRAMGSTSLAKDLHRDARSFIWFAGTHHTQQPKVSLTMLLRVLPTCARPRASSILRGQQRCHQKQNVPN